MFHWNDDLTPKQSDGRWDSIRKLLTATPFSNNHFCIAAAHWSDLYSRWFIADTADDNILHKTWFVFVDQLSHLNTETLATVHLSHYVAKRRQFFFFFFCVTPRSSLDIKWTDLSKALSTQHQSAQIMNNFVIRRKYSLTTISLRRAM